MEYRELQTETVIIGAGYAGIAAAKRLHEAGRDFLVLEARDRIGGRTLTQTLDSGATVDLGAQWIGPDQHLVWDWVRETGTETYECHDSGKNILMWRGKHTTYKGTIPRIDPLSLADLGLALARLDRMGRQIDVNAPWSHKRAHKWDGMTVATWMDRHLYTRKARHLFEVGIETVFAAAPEELSLLGALFYARSGQSFEKLISVTGGAQQTLLNHGIQTLLKKVSGPFEDNILLGEPVERIVQTGEGVALSGRRTRVFARRVILALPPALLDRIRFEPVLPQRKAQLVQRMPMGAAMKCFCIYDKPFWRARGFSGQIVSDSGPVKVTFDCSKSDDSHGILLVFVEAQEARDFVEVAPDERRRRVLEGLAATLGPEAGNPLEYIDKCWTEEEWSRGCYTGIMPPGLLTQFRDTARQPFGRLHFAGTETATEWNGYLDGAIQSGYREAGAVLSVLR